MRLRLYTPARGMILATALLVQLSMAGAVSAQSGPSSATTDAEATDVAKINAVVTSFYEAISSPAGGKIDHAQLDALFVPSGRIGSVRPPNGSTPAAVNFVTPDQYADGVAGFLAKYGFFDKVLHNRIERYGLMAHVYSSYESRNDPKDPNPMARGIKSIELLKSADKWLIVEVYFNSETPDNHLPSEYVPK